MTRDEAEVLLWATVPLVRLHPESPQGGKRRGGHRKHWGRGRLLSLVGDDRALVQVFKHRRNEIVPLEQIKPWRAQIDHGDDGAAHVPTLFDGDGDRRSVRRDRRGTVRTGDRRPD